MILRLHIHIQTSMQPITRFCYLVMLAENNHILTLFIYKAYSTKTEEANNIQQL